MAQAQYGLKETGGKIGYEDTVTVESVVARVITGGLALIAIVFLLLTLYAGLRWMTARGNAEFADKAKTTLEAAIIGLAITVAAYAITNLVLKSLGN